MSSSQLDWLVPECEWDPFVAFVENKWGSTMGYLGREVDLAMREWLNADGYDEVENGVRRLVRATGRSSDSFSHEEKTVSSAALANENKTRASCQVHSPTKREFKVSSQKNSDDDPGVVLARALREYRQANRLDRIGAMVIRNEGESSSSSESLSLRDKRTIEVVRRLGDEFSQDELDDAIGSVAGDSEPTLRAYRKRVINHLDYVTHPNVSQIYVPRARAKEIAANTGSPSLDAPAIDRKAYEVLDHDEKVRGIRIELAREAAPQGKARASVKDVHHEVFDSCGSDSHIRALIKDAATADGYSFRRPFHSGPKRLTVDLSAVTSTAVRSALDIDIDLDLDHEGDKANPDDNERNGDRACADGSTSGDDIESQGDARIEAPMNASTATNGEDPPPQD
jgi:hypothetical protein